MNSLVDTYAMHIQFILVESVDEPATKQTLDELTYVIDAVLKALKYSGIDVPVLAPRGFFTRPLAPGLYTITASARGYSPQSQVVKVPSNGLGVQAQFKLQALNPADIEPIPAATFPYTIIAGRNMVRSHHFPRMHIRVQNES